MVSLFWVRCGDRVFFDAFLITIGGTGRSDIFANAIYGLKNRRPALERAFMGKSSTANARMAFEPCPRP
jgi:hypothetical protein